MPESKVVLVTGASSGIGCATAALLAQKGFNVFGTARNPSGIETIPGVNALPLDVCLDESVTDCLNRVLEITGRLDILINNAGYGLTGAIEEATLEEVKAQFETNVYGVARMVKAVLSVMRKQGSGQIINISSMAGIAALPFWGYYSASKFAVEGFTEALRHECKPLGIHISLVEPGYIKTNFDRNQQVVTNQISDYDPWRSGVVEANLRYFEKAVRSRYRLNIKK